jgi:hypothetical protein
MSWLKCLGYSAQKAKNLKIPTSKYSGSSGSSGSSIFGSDQEPEESEEPELK